MKVKTIKAIISKKMKQWWDSIEDESLREEVKDSTIVTGGCITSMLLKEPVNDFDVYFRNKDVAKKVAQYYVERFKVKNKAGIDCAIYVTDEDNRIKIVVKSSGIASEEGTDKEYDFFEHRQDNAAEGYVSDIMTDPGAIEDVYEETETKALAVEEKGYRPIFMSTNAITLSNKIQLVLRFYGEPEVIHKNYDFIHCTNYWQSWGEVGLVLNQKSLEAILAKELRYVGSLYPVCSLFRLRKFINRGWSINAGQILKIAFQISELDLTDLKVLEDQLTGVDVAYFIQLVNKLKENDAEKVNSAYLVEILDRMF